MTPKHTSMPIDAEALYASLLGNEDPDTLGLVLNHLELSRQAIEWLMNREVEEKAGAYYSHDKPHDSQFSRWGSNPGSIRIGAQRVPVKVPRIRDNFAETTQKPVVYEQLHSLQRPPAHVMRALLLGLSTRRYAEAAEVLMDSFGLSKSALSEAFIEHSAEILEQFLQRRLDDVRYVAMFIDGKILAKQHIVVAIGVDEHGEKRTLGITQASTENATAIAEMLRDMIGRGFDAQHGILAVVDGGKGLSSALKEVFGSHVVVQRCRAHKVRNVVSHFAPADQATWKRRISKLFACEDYAEAVSIAEHIHADLEKINRSAARSFQEGLDEILTITRLGLAKYFAKSLSTTNIIESTFSSTASMTRNVKRWTDGDQRLRWYAAALAEIEPKWRKIENYARIPMLQRAILLEVQRVTDPSNANSKPRRFSTK